MRTQDAKNIHCKDYLEKIGAKFSRSQQGTNGIEYVFHSPSREDTKPSLCVNLDRNIWSDVPAGEGGRLIELVCYTNGLIKNDVREALSILDQLFPEYRGAGSSNTTPNTAVGSILSLPKSVATSLNKKEQGSKLLKVREIYRYPLKNYLSERKIPLNIAQKYIEEVDYEDSQGRKFYALGWKCGATYSLRSKNFKGFLGKGADISVFDTGASELYLFEGMFDYLAYLANSKRESLPVTVIILNSVALDSRVQKWLSENSHVQRVNCFFDNDEAGQRAFLKLQRNCPHQMFHDYSQQYFNFKDYAEWFESQ